jgi:hypothetical protein
MSVRAPGGMASGERLNTRRISKSKRIDALVVITSDKDRGACGDETVDKIQIHRIQVLKFIYNQVLNLEQLDWIDITRIHFVNALPHDFAGQHTGVHLRSWAVKIQEYIRFAL